MGLRFNPPPNWPLPPPGFVPPPRWQPDPSWPPPPPGWQLWVEDSGPDPRRASGLHSWADTLPATAVAGSPADAAGLQARPGAFGNGPAQGPPRAGGAGSELDGMPPRAVDATGPPVPTEAYLPAVTGPQTPYSPHDPLGAQGPGPDGPAGELERRPGAPGRTSGFAAASFVLGVIGVTVVGAILSVILGITALGQIRRTGQRGRGLAIAGLVLSGLWLVLIAGYLVLHAGSSPGRPSAPTRHNSPRQSSPASPGAPSTNVFSLRPGQCFQNPPASQTVVGVTYVTMVPCGTPHNAQAFAQFTATGTGYPGAGALMRQADAGCRARIQKNLQTSKIKDTMSLHYLFPLQSSWKSGHRAVTCFIVSSKPNLTASLLRPNSAP